MEEIILSRDEGFCLASFMQGIILSGDKAFCSALGTIIALELVDGLKVIYAVRSRLLYSWNFFPIGHFLGKKFIFSGNYLERLNKVDSQLSAELNRLQSENVDRRRRHSFIGGVEAKVRSELTTGLMAIQLVILRSV